MKNYVFRLIAVFSLFGLSAAQAANAPSAKPARVPRAIVLPDYCNAPDAMAVLPDGNIILSVPNFTDPTSPGVLMKITPNDEVYLF